MARSNNVLKNFGIGLAVALAAFGIGYYVLSGPRTAPAATDVLPAPVAVPASHGPARMATTPAPHISPRLKNSDYTSPDAPRIRIVEGRTPSLTLTHRPADSSADIAPASPADSEASQTAASPSASSSPSTDASSGAATGTASPDATNPAAPNPAPLIPPAATPPASPAPDQDFEQTGSGHASAEAGQDGQPTGKAQFRVQTGSFAAQQNARALADALRGRGYTTSTRAEQENGKTVYKVQIGAYRSRAAADKAAQDLQKSGYPAYSSPVGP